MEFPRIFADKEGLLTNGASVTTGFIHQLRNAFFRRLLVKIDLWATEQLQRGRECLNAGEFAPRQHQLLVQCSF